MVPVRIPLAFPPPHAKPFDAVGLGLNSLDLVAVVDGHPPPNSKQPLRRFVKSPGGQIATALVVIARHGWRARYIGRFGDDEFGSVCREALRRAGVDLTPARVVSGASNQFAIVLVDASTGERTVLWDRDRRLAMTPDEVPVEAVTSGRLLLVDCHETAAAARAARLAREAGIPTLVDVEQVRPGIEELLRHIDAIIAAEAFPAALTGHTDPARAVEVIGRRFGAAVVTVTLGGAGSLTWCGGRVFETPAFKVACRDSTGAGDVFRGAFAAACLRHPEGDLEDAVRYANAAAALKCRNLGAQLGIPSPADVDRLVRAGTT